MKIRKFRKGKHEYTLWGNSVKEVRTLPPARKRERISIECDKKTALGVYSNGAAISHRQGEFAFDFFFVPPGGKRGRLAARIITSPLHAKRLLRVLEQSAPPHEKTAD